MTGVQTCALPIYQAQLLEEKKKEVETEFEQAIRKARSCGMEDSEIRALFEIVLEDS